MKSEPTTATRLTRCSQCKSEKAVDQLAKSLLQVERLAERLEPGSEVPAGECECGAFVYWVPNDPVLRERIKRLTAAVEDDDTDSALHEARNIVVSLMPRIVDVI